MKLLKREKSRLKSALLKMAIFIGHLILMCLGLACLALGITLEAAAQIDSHVNTIAVVVSVVSCTSVIAGVIGCVGTCCSRRCCLATDLVCLCALIILEFVTIGMLINGQVAVNETIQRFLIKIESFSIPVMVASKPKLVNVTLHRRMSKVNSSMHGVNGHYNIMDYQDSNTQLFALLDGNNEPAGNNTQLLFKFANSTKLESHSNSTRTNPTDPALSFYHEGVKSNHSSPSMLNSEMDIFVLGDGYDRKDIDMPILSEDTRQVVPVPDPPAAALDPDEGRNDTWAIGPSTPLAILLESSGSSSSTKSSSSRPHGASVVFSFENVVDSDESTENSTEYDGDDHEGNEANMTWVNLGGIRPIEKSGAKISHAERPAKTLSGEDIRTATNELIIETLEALHNMMDAAVTLCIFQAIIEATMIIFSFKLLRMIWVDPGRGRFESYKSAGKNDSVIVKCDKPDKPKKKSVGFDSPGITVTKFTESSEGSYVAFEGTKVLTSRDSEDTGKGRPRKAKDHQSQDTLCNETGTWTYERIRIYGISPTSRMKDALTLGAELQEKISPETKKFLQIPGTKLNRIPRSDTHLSETGTADLDLKFNQNRASRNSF